MVVADVGDQPITLKEYEDMYIKSNGSREGAAKSTLEEREKFLDLMTKFRLKLADAYQQRLDKSPEIQKEINLYRGSLASSFLTEREVTGPGVKKMFDARRTEFRARHILLNLGSVPTPEDSAAAYSKAYALIDSLKAGADFAGLAIRHSQDPSVSQNKGDLYYFTAGQMVPPFEDAVREMKPGEISLKPVRTSFGLHVINLIDRKPSPGEIKCSHIMIRFTKQDLTPEDTATAFAKLKAIQDSLALGMDFVELAKRNSEDPGSASRGGDLGWFARRRWVQEFDEAAFHLKPGQASGIVRTRYGYHLIKCYDAHPPKTFEESKDEIRKLYQQSRFQEDYKTFLAGLKQETQFSLNENVVSDFIAACDSTKTTKDTTWTDTITPELGSSAIIAFGKNPVTVDSVAGIINSRADMANTPLNARAINNVLDKVIEQLVFSAKVDSMQRHYPEFAGIMKEYVDGILLYQIEQDRVWNSINVNDSSLMTYFDSHRDKFVYPDRVEFSELRAVNDSVVNMISDQLEGAKTFDEIVTADSARLKASSNFQILFSNGSARINSKIAKVLQTVADEMESDKALKMRLTAHIDTSQSKSENEKLASQRFNAIKSHWSNKHGIPGGRIVTISRPLSKNEKGQIVLNNSIDLELIGRKSILLGGIGHHVLPDTTDDRAKRAMSLSVGEFSRPFKYQSSYSIVQLHKRLPSRQKTFAEAGTEISSAFQEFEAKRLEDEWLKELRGQFPVVEYKEVLKHAFVSVEQ
jgi:peptidyl-prolyl cis-trans isomerase SurA